MSGLKNTFKRAANFAVGRGYSTKKERHAKRMAAEKGRLDAIYAGADMPDEEVQRREARRRQAGRRGSRASTILTDTLG